MTTFSFLISAVSKLSALVIIYNEERHLPEAVTQLDFVDEIIVVDSYSTDKTLSILEGLSNVKIYKNTFKDYASQRNFALSKASHEWVLFIDADERIPKDLKDEIVETITKKKSKDAYLFKRQYYFKNKKVRFSGMQTSKVYRLFKKSKAHYTSKHLVHERLIVAGDTGTLKNKMKHYFYHSYEQQKQKSIGYGKLKGKELFLKGKSVNWFKLYIKPMWKFINEYIIRLGILDGKMGIIICYMKALSVSMRYKELKRLNISAQSQN